MAIELKAAAHQDTFLYTPYYDGNRKTALPYAITLYKQAEMQGERQVEGSASVPFQATWRVATLPTDLTLCTVQFEGDAELRYEVMMASSEFVGYLIDVVSSIRDKGEEGADFPQMFYSKLFRIKISTD
jgi:hypothetical protein